MTDNLPTTGSELDEYLQPPSLDEPYQPDYILAEELNEITQRFIKTEPLDDVPSKSALDAMTIIGLASKDDRTLRRMRVMAAEALTQRYLAMPWNKLFAIISELIPSLEYKNERLSISVFDYVDLPKHIPEQMSLRYQAVTNGRIDINQEQLKFLLMHHLINRYQIKQPPRMPGWLKDNFKTWLTPVNREIGKKKRQQTATRKLGIQEQFFPPCIKYWIDEIGNGRQLTHHENFNLVSFLCHFGMTNKEIIDIFRTSPIFNENRTTYQVRHITKRQDDEEVGDGGYYTMGCKQLRDLDLCPDLKCAGPTPIIRYAKDVRKGRKPTKYQGPSGSANNNKAQKSKPNRYQPPS